MKRIEIPGNKVINLENIVLDYNGTIAFDGKLKEGVKEKINKLSEIIDIYVITADTFGNAQKELKDIKCSIKILKKDNQDNQKRDFILKLGEDRTIAIGNGLNDRLMLETAILGICTIQEEGAATKTILNSDVVVKNILDAFCIILNEKRLQATLRK